MTLYLLSSKCRKTATEKQIVPVCLYNVKAKSIRVRFVRLMGITFDTAVNQGQCCP